MTERETPIYEPGDVVYGVDPYKGDEAARPWLIISNHDGRPFRRRFWVVLIVETEVPSVYFRSRSHVAISCWNRSIHSRFSCNTSYTRSWSMVP
ncbi:hypothetical protein C491_17132 [Natronococcus amylolyticus DSM 10524]|uniref:PemK family protein n=1 Tax=Natronococcus amylolyticus DSM 10524 TaxID=1227497 RepID=L9X4E3_9EURY|nr:hypothetical protein C491_17132 [Natronococcus amylolyticus DSM 10524]